MNKMITVTLAVLVLSSSCQSDDVEDRVPYLFGNEPMELRNCHDPNEVWAIFGPCDEMCRSEDMPCKRILYSGCRCRDGFKRYERWQKCFPQEYCAIPPQPAFPEQLEDD